MALVVVVLIGIAALTGVAVLLGMSDSPLSMEPVDRVDDGLPARPLTSQDIGGLRFRVGLRGYRMDDVDLALDRLRDALRDAEQRVADAKPSVEPGSVEPGSVEPESPARPTRTRKGAAPVEPKPARARKTAPPAEPDGA